MKELVASHVEDQLRSVQTETNAGKWDPQKMGPNKQVSRKVPSHHGSAHSPMKEYGLGVKNQVTAMDMGLLTLVHPTMWHSVTRDVETKEMQLG